MKKGFLAILAALTVFALVMTGCETESGPTGDKTYSITFNANFTGGETKVVKIVKDGYIAAAAIPKFTQAGYRLSGWAAAAAGAEVDPTAAPVTANATYYAQWVQQITITFDKNGGVGGTTKQVDKGSEYTIPGSGDGGVSFAGKVFASWDTAATPSATSTSYAVGAKIDSVDAPITLYAQWKGPTAVAPANDIEETLSLGNSWFAVYKFELASGKKWSDYKNGGLIANYKLSQALIDNGMARAIRVMGNFTAAEVNGTVYTYKGTQQANVDGAALANSGPLADYYNGLPIATVAQWQGGNSAPYILSQMGGAWADNNMATELGKLGITPVANTYFAVSYIIDGSKKNASYDSAKRLPADSATGPFYFAIGLPGQNSANEFSVKNVTLVGTTAGTADVIGKPLLVKNTGAAALYRVFNGQFTKDGGNGTELARWDSSASVYSDATKIATIDKNLSTDPAQVIITYNVNLPGDAAPTPLPVNSNFRILSGEGLADRQLIKPELGNYLITGWFDATTAGNAIAAYKVENGTVSGTTFTTNTTIYAQWRPFIPNSTPKVITPVAADFTFYGSLTASDMDADGWINMKDASAAVGFAYPTPVAGAKPVIEEYLKVKFEYQVDTGTATVTNLTASVSVKTTKDGWTTITSATGPQYPDLTARGETTGSGTVELLMSGLNGGFAVQNNATGHVATYKLKITKITFYN